MQDENQNTDPAQQNAEPVQDQTPEPTSPVFNQTPANTTPPVDGGVGQPDGPVLDQNGNPVENSGDVAEAVFPDGSSAESHDPEPVLDQNGNPVTNSEGVADAVPAGQNPQEPNVDDSGNVQGQ